MKYTEVDSVFYANYEYAISWYHKPHVSVWNVSNTSQKGQKLCLDNSMVGSIPSGQPWEDTMGVPQI